MAEPSIGSEAVASGALTPYALRNRFVPIHRNVFIPHDAEVTAVARVAGGTGRLTGLGGLDNGDAFAAGAGQRCQGRSEERRVGKEC